jgi:hypothetical protein
MRINRIISGGAVAAACLAAAACGSGGSRPAAVAQAPPKARAAPAVDPATRALAAMVDAVGPSRGHAPVNLKFSIRERPEVGQDDAIDYAVVPRVGGLASLRVAFGSLSGLTVVSHESPLTAIKPASGVPIFGSVTVRPSQAGLFTLTAVVAVESADRTVAWPFSIPVIAGAGAARTAGSQP